MSNYHVHPQFTVTADDVDVSSDSLHWEVVRPENGVSRVRLFANDYEGKLFIGHLDTFSVLNIKVRLGSSSWTTIFEGVVEEVGPALLESGQTVTALAYGYGRALRNTFCNTSYGAESENTTLDTPKEIWDDLVTNYVNLSFGGGATGYALTNTYVDNITSPTINYLHNPLRSNMQTINDVCQLVCATRAGSTGPHWMIDTDKNLRVKYVDSDQTGWPMWWNNDQDGSTLIQGVDFLEYTFTKNIRNYANRVLLATDLRKPGYDDWTERRAAGWGLVNATVADQAASTPGNLNAIVGSNLLEGVYVGIAQTTIYYPGGIASNWDFTKVGAPREPPTLNFYAAVNDVAMTLNVRLYTTNLNNYYQVAIAGDFPAVEKWRHFSLPIGPYYAEPVDSTVYTWSVVNAPDWSNIDAVGFNWLPVVGAPIEYVWIDDLHFSGKIIRDAYNSTAIAANKEHQAVLKMDVAVDDVLTAAVDTGTAGMLAYASLLVAQTTPIVGTVTVPGLVDVLPGQTVHIQADKQKDGSYRVDGDFRVKRVIHRFGDGFTSLLELTDDVTNTFAKGPVDYVGLYHKVMYTDPEAQSLKTSGINPRVPFLSKDYP